MLRIALPNKGRLSDDARELFGQAGLDVRSTGDRALTASLGGEFEAIFVRAQDIPEFVADDAADAGITGFDLASESGRNLDSRPNLTVLVMFEPLPSNLSLLPSSGLPSSLSPLSLFPLEP